MGLSCLYGETIMGNLSEHFSREEFLCGCNKCGFDTVDIQLLEILETVRHRYMRPIKITSGCRCEEHNKKEGGAPKSQHILGRAADFKVQGINPKEVFEFLCRAYPDTFGFKAYSSWVHADSRTEKWRG